MSLKYNILVGYASQAYITIISIIVVPLYLHHMGVEAYGLVGFFTLLQTWFQFLDPGLTATILRETANYRGGATDSLSYLQLFHTLQLFFVLVAVLGISSIFIVSEAISNSWLNVQTLALTEVRYAVQMMALGAGLRWMAGLYRGVLSGYERLVWLGYYNAFIATLRFGGALFIIIFISAAPSTFFTYQVGVALVEVGMLATMSYRLVPTLDGQTTIDWSFAPIRPVLKFSLSIAFTSSVWVLATQADKFILSKLLLLTDYGYFTLAVLVANSVLMITGPISNALLPRMTTLEAQSDHTALIRLYRQTTQLVCVLTFPIVFTLASLAEPMLWAWTGDPIAAVKAAPILQLYVIGNGVLVIVAFPYYLQYAKGNLRLHLIGNVIFVCLLVPALILSTWHYSGIGAGWVWLLSNVIYLIVWVPLIHKQFDNSLHRQWLTKDTLPVITAAGIAAWLVWWVSTIALTRSTVISMAIIFGSVIIIAAGLASSEVRVRLRCIWQYYRKW